MRQGYLMPVFSLRELIFSSITILLFLIAFSANSKNLLITESTGDYVKLGSYIELYEEKNSTLLFSEILNAPIEWNKNDKDIINLGYTESTYWYRLSITNQNYKKIDRLLAIEYPPLDKVDLYWGNKAMGFAHERFGRSLPFNARKIKNRNWIQAITIKPNQSIDVYLKVKTDSAMQLPLYLWTEQALIENEQNTVMIHGIYFGMTLIMLFYNLFLYLSIRDKTYLVYVGSVFFVILVQASLRGFSYQYLFPDYPLIEKYQLPIAISVAGALLAVFSIMFLQLKTRSTKLYYVVYSVAVILFSIAILSPFIGYSLAVRLSVIVNMLYSMLAAYTGFYIWYKGYKPASFFSIAYIVFFVAIILLSLNKLGLMERTFLTEYTVEIGSGLEVVLLSFALAYRISILKQEKEQAQKDLTLNLEKKISERTTELNETLEQLSSMNIRLARQNIEDSLSGVFNRRHFDSVIANEWNHALRSQTSLTLIMADIDHFKIFNDVHGHTVGDECIRLVGYTIKSNVTRMGDMVFRYGGEEFSIILPVTDAAGGEKVAEAICAAISRLKITTQDSQEISVTISLGIASIIPNRDMKPEDLVKQADQALYSAKNLGRNCVVVFE